MKTNSKKLILFLLSFLCIANLHAAKKSQENPYQERPTVLDTRVAKIKKWNNPSFIEGDSRLNMLTQEFENNFKELTSFQFEEFLKSWSNYLKQVFFDKTYTEAKSKILKNFMNNYMKNVFDTYKDWNVG